MHRERFLWLWVSLASLTIASPAVPQEGTGQTEERFRLRIENSPLGRVEVSVDGGESYHLFGRITRPATVTLPDRAVTASGRVIQASRDGLAFSTGTGLMMKVLPWTSGGKGRPAVLPTQPSAAQTNRPVASPLWSAFVPPPGSNVRLEVRPGDLTPFPEGYTPSIGDIYVFLAPSLTPDSSVADREKLRVAARNGGKDYAKESLERAKVEGRKVVRGTLTLEAKLPEGEPDPIVFVTFSIDGSVVSTQNTPPFRYEWETRIASEGEHTVEVRALNAQGRTLTHTRALVVVHNDP